MLLDRPIRFSGQEINAILVQKPAQPASNSSTPWLPIATLPTILLTDNLTTAINPTLPILVCTAIERCEEAVGDVTVTSLPCGTKPLESLPSSYRPFPESPFTGPAAVDRLILQTVNNNLTSTVFRQALRQHYLYTCMAALQSAVSFVIRGACFVFIGGYYAVLHYSLAALQHLPCCAAIFISCIIHG